MKVVSVCLLFFFLEKCNQGVSKKKGDNVSISDCEEKNSQHLVFDSFMH